MSAKYIANFQQSYPNHEATYTAEESLPPSTADAHTPVALPNHWSFLISLNTWLSVLAVGSTSNMLTMLVWSSLRVIWTRCVLQRNPSNLLITQDGINQSAFPSIVKTNEADQNLLMTLPELNFNISGIWLVFKKFQFIVTPFIQLHLSGLHTRNTMLHIITSKTKPYQPFEYLTAITHFVNIAKSSMLIL